MGSDRRRREAREDRLELTQEQRENKRGAQFRTDARKPRSPDLKDDKGMPNEKGYGTVE